MIKYARMYDLYFKIIRFISWNKRKLNCFVICYLLACKVDSMETFGNLRGLILEWALAQSFRETKAHLFLDDGCDALACSVRFRSKLEDGGAPIVYLWTRFYRISPAAFGTATR